MLPPLLSSSSPTLPSLPRFSQEPASKSPLWPCFSCRHPPYPQLLGDVVYQWPGWWGVQSTIQTIPTVVHPSRSPLLWHFSPSSFWFIFLSQSFSAYNQTVMPPVTEAVILLTGWVTWASVECWSWPAGCFFRNLAEEPLSRSSLGSFPKPHPNTLWFSFFHVRTLRSLLSTPGLSSWLLFKIFIYLFLAMLGLHCYSGFSLVALSGGHS